MDEVGDDASLDPAAAAAAASGSSTIRYTLERIEIRGNDRTDDGAIRPYLPLRAGEVLDVDDPRLEAVRWRLLGTGWFDEVRLRLERGEERGHVVLVVEVSERNTFLVQSVALGFSEGLFDSDDADVQLEPYFGLSVAELNLFGTGVSLEATGLVSLPQQGVRLRAGQASVGGGDFGLTGALFFNNGREFFGNDDVVIALDECPMRGPDELRCEESRNAVVVYRRYGASLGTGVDLATTLRFTLDWQFELVEVVDRPDAASHLRGTEIVPIDFGIQDGWSRVSALRLGLAHDERDNPGLPTSGRHVFLNADVSTTLIGSSYDFVRVQAGWREWFRLPEARHTLRLGLFVGAAVGETPFFYRFYVADLSDLIPSRVLELNLDRRAPPNLLDTSVREMRAQELAGRVDVEYSLWLYEGEDELRGVIVYGLVGLYTLLDREDLQVAIPGYEGFARAPIDLTFDVGVRLDTVVGVFELGFSTLLGFVSL
ncbi:MAG TPA: BamA/TamA family outer membrane protein [Sandaracinaceae bacterium LLY-WYZ-13_1]|nr:BamA/TamA family outer membrane protein [Sandaracinaceae bacterium LLY-WYZ-13_1]